MGSAFNRLVAILGVFIFFLLSIWVITGTTVAGVGFRRTTTTASAIDDINNTIVSYIQKNGQFFDESPTEREEFLGALASVHGLDLATDANCKYCVDVEIKPNKGTTFYRGAETQRSTIYEVNTKYNYPYINFNFVNLKQRWRPAKTRKAEAYVHQYINDGVTEGSYKYN